MGRVNWRALVAFTPALSLVGCGGGSAQRAPAPPRAQLATLGALDPAEAYRRAGFFAASGPVSFVGSVRSLAGPTPDSALAVVAVSLPSSSLTFTREGERYRATYEVEFDLLRQTEGTARAAGRFKARETVRVANLQETTRDEESVIFQQIVVVPPGEYTAALVVRDLGSNRSGTAEASVDIPQFPAPATPVGTVGSDTGGHATLAGATRASRLATPLTVHTATPRGSRAALPDLVVSARSTTIFGRDSVIRLYFEWYGAGPTFAAGRAPAVRFSVRSADGRELHADTVRAATWAADGQVAAATARVPVAKVGPGRMRVTAWRADGIDGADTASAPMFVSALDGLAAVSFEELLSYLRHFATGERLRALRDTAPEARAAAWTGFLRATDPLPSTPEHEGLREYFARLAVANARFRGEEVPGWLSDRGTVYSTLGEPDRVVEPRREIQQRGAAAGERAQVWEYAQHRLRLVFVEQGDGRRWRLTPASEAEFQATAERVRR